MTVLSKTTNYNLQLYSSTDTDTKFLDFRIALCGDQPQSNMQIIDSVLKRLDDSIQDIQTIPQIYDISLLYVSPNFYNGYLEGFPGYKDSQLFALRFQSNNNDAGDSSLTININSFGNKSVVRINKNGAETQLTAGTISTNFPYIAIYTSNKFVVTSIPVLCDYATNAKEAEHALLADKSTESTTAQNANTLNNKSPEWYMPTGSVIPYAGTSLPDGWLWCGGNEVSRTTYSALFAVIGTTYGNGNGSSTFNVPDLSGRVVAMRGSGQSVGDTAGSDTKQITRANLPNEKLNLEDNGTWIVDSTQTGSESGKTLQMGSRSNAARLETNPLGSGTPFDVRQSTIYMNYIIKY